MKVTKVYYGHGIARVSYDLPVLNENGEPIYQTNREGNPIYSNGKKVVVDNHREFTTLQSARTAKLEPLCIKQFESDEKGNFTPEQLAEIAICEKMAADPKSSVMHEDTYKNMVNPNAFRAEKQFEELKKQYETETKQVVENALSGANAQIAELQKQLAALNGNQNDLDMEEKRGRGRPLKK